MTSVDAVPLVENDDGVFVTPDELRRERMERMCAAYAQVSVSMARFSEGLRLASAQVASLGAFRAVAEPGPGPQTNGD